MRMLCQAVSHASYHFVELVAIVSLGYVFELASNQIAVLFEETDIPVACICEDHRSVVFLCEFLCFLQKIRAQAFSSQRLFHKQCDNGTAVAFFRVRDHACRKSAFVIHKLFAKINGFAFMRAA